MKELTTAIAADQDILVNTYKGRRDETMAMLTPVQQGEYLLGHLEVATKIIGKIRANKKPGSRTKEKKEKAP